jgi:hypothetical protein
MNATEILNLVLTITIGGIVLLNHYALKQAAGILNEAMALIGRVEVTRDAAIKLNGELVVLLDLLKKTDKHNKLD